MAKETAEWHGTISKRFECTLHTFTHGKGCYPGMSHKILNMHENWVPVCYAFINRLRSMGLTVMLDIARCGGLSKISTIMLWKGMKHNNYYMTRDN